MTLSPEVSAMLMTSGSGILIPFVINFLRQAKWLPWLENQAPRIKAAAVFLSALSTFLVTAKTGGLTDTSVHGIMSDGWTLLQTLGIQAFMHHWFFKPKALPAPPQA